MVDVRKNIITLEQKILNFTATADDIEHWAELKKRETELWEEYGNHYINDYFYKRYFPNDNYAMKRFLEVQNK